MKSLPLPAYPFCFACALAVNATPFYLIYQSALQPAASLVQTSAPVVPIEVIRITHAGPELKKKATPYLLPPHPPQKSQAPNLPDPNHAAVQANAVKEEEKLSPLLRIKPAYPLTALQQGIEGWVELEFALSQQGAVLQPKVLASHPYAVFERSVLDAVIQWRYPSPIFPTAAKQTVRIEFRLEE